MVNQAQSASQLTIQAVANIVSESRNGDKKLTPAAARALAEAEARRKQTADRKGTKPEIGGRGGEDSVRYGDWEIRGLISDF